MRVVRFGKLCNDAWFVYDATPYRSGKGLYKLKPTSDPAEEECVVPCINLLTAQVEYFRLDDKVLIPTKEDIEKLNGGDGE